MKYDSSKTRRAGQSSAKEEIVQLVLKLAKENELWGHTNIRDAVNNLGHEISRDTVANILREHGIQPVPERGPRAHSLASALPPFFNMPRPFRISAAE